MGTAKNAERTVVLELTELLQKNAERVYSGDFRVCLTTHSLGIIANLLRRLSESPEQDEQEATGPMRSRAKQEIDMKKWQEKTRILQDFIQKITALKIIHGSYTMKGPIQIARFRSLQVLEVKKVPIHMVEGLSRLRGQLREVFVSKCLQTLQDLLEICGGDRSSGLVWAHLKAAYLSFNGLQLLDASLRFVPFLEILDLSHNSINKTEDHLMSLTNLMRCNLGYNMLTAFPKFAMATRGRLKTLVLRNNSLENLEGVEELTALEELDVSENFIISHTVLEPLTDLGHLQVLCLTGNPLCYKENHRQLTLDRLSSSTARSFFLLDGRRLTTDEIRLMQQNRFRRKINQSDSHQPADQQSSTSTTTADVHVGDERGSGSFLTPTGTLKKKKGHRRVLSKERLPTIINIEDSFNSSECEAPRSKGASPTGSMVDESDLAKAADDRKHYERMREHYKDDWLKALAVEQKRFSPGIGQNDMDVTDGPVANNDKTSGKSETGQSSTGKTVSDKIVGGKEGSPVKEKILKSTTASDTSAEVMSPKSPKSPKSPMSPVDIYAIKRGLSVTTSFDEDVPKAEEEDVPEMDSSLYGDESEPFIVMLPQDDMRQLFVTVNQRFLIEKDLHGNRLAVLDLKCLLDLKKSEERCYGSNIIGGLAFPILTMEFDYVRKDKRERKYAMEDDPECKKFETLIQHHVKPRQGQVTEMMECLKCKEQFPQNKESTKLQKCPKCKSKMVIKLNSFSITAACVIEQSQECPELSTNQHLRTSSASKFSRKQRSAMRRSAREVDQSATSDSETLRCLGSLHFGSGGAGSLKDYVDSLIPDTKDFAADVTSTQGTDAPDSGQSQLAGSSSERSGLKASNSWSDVRRGQSARGSSSSVDSDITILATNSKGSVATISETSHESLLTDAGREKNAGMIEVYAGSGEVGSPEIKNNDKTAVISTNGANWLNGDKRQITPVGSPLTISVCSSMVSSVYENTLPGGGEDGGVVTQTAEGSLTSSSADSVSIRPADVTCRRSRSRSPYRQTVVVDGHFSANADNQNPTLLASNRSLTNDKTDSLSIYDEASYKTCSNSTNVSINVEDTSRTSIYDSFRSEADISSENSRQSSTERGRSRDLSLSDQLSTSQSSPLRRSGSRGRQKDKRSAMIQDEILSSESELGNKSQLDNFPSELSPIKRRGSDRRSPSGNRRTVITSNVEISAENGADLSNVSSVFQSNTKAKPEGNAKDDSYVSEASSDRSRLPWEQEESVSDSSKHESLNHEEFINIDHRVQLHLELKVFTAEETCQCAIRCPVVQYMQTSERDSLLVISTNRILIFGMEAELESCPDVSECLKCYEDQPITDLVYVDIGFGHQSLRLEFSTLCSSYSLIIADEGRCKRFLTLLTDIMRTVAMHDHSRLEGISKSNPTTQSNIEDLLHGYQDGEEETDGQTLVRYFIVRCMDDDADSDEEGRLLSLFVTTTDLLLVKENHQWPLPRLQAPLSGSIKGQQFMLLQRERINNIEKLEFNEYNPKELRLSFSEHSNADDSKPVWMIAMETTRGVKAFVDAIRDPWEEEFGITLDVTSTSFNDSD